MIYYNEEGILIRDIVWEDAQKICDEEIAQGWNQTIDKYYTRLADFNSKKAICELLHKDPGYDWRVLFKD